MLHRWKLYINEGDRRLPSLVEDGTVDLPCINPDVDSYQHRFDPRPLWEFLQHTLDASLHGLYLSLVSTDRPTYDGKQWFIKAAHEEPASPNARLDRRITWKDIKKIHFWSSNLREYTRLYQVRAIKDYTTYVSRCFGYVFMTGLCFDDEDDEERSDFTTFFPSIHHYNAYVSINESNLWQTFSRGTEWLPFRYDELVGEDSNEDSNADSPPSLTTAVEAMNNVAQAARSLVPGRWGDGESGIDLEDVLLESINSEDGEND